MKRFVYAPKVKAFVKADSGIIDLTPHLVRGSVSRKLDQVSTANLEFRNPQKRFTNNGSPLIHPMDPIVIFMQRLENRPVQVFTGYVDTSPYFALKPTGNLTLEASCTLKKLLYTYYDPGLKFFHEFLIKQGWINVGGDSVLPPGSGESVNESDGLNDASFGNLLYETLLFIGNWDPSSIYIENLPDGIVDVVEKIFEQNELASRKDRNQIRKILEYILENNTYYGSGSLGSDGSNDNSLPNGPVGTKINDFKGNSPSALLKGKVSWFRDGQTASGISASTNPGVSLNLVPGTDQGWNNEVTDAWMKWAREGRPMFVKVTTQGKSAEMPILDKGPAGWTNRAIDISVPGVYKMGFRNLSDFKTDEQGTVQFLGRKKL